MKLKHHILSFVTVIFFCVGVHCQTTSQTKLDFYGDSIELPFEKTLFIDFKGPLSEASIKVFYEQMKSANYTPVVKALLDYKQKEQPDDWLYYQLIRRVAQTISPKADNYFRYTLYKWYFLTQSGYDATINISDDQMLFYVQCDENIYDIPSHTKNGKQYVCLNYHDYGSSIDFTVHHFKEVELEIPTPQNSFSYKITKLPSFTPGDYQEKDVEFTYNDNEYHFRVKLNPQVKNIFANYPVVDYARYFNMPLSKETYSSLIPALKKNLKGMSTKSGVDYLMRFTRDAFSFEPDTKNFGKEKRLSPEQTLLYEYSDCEDRAALFFYLVKEIYNVPMIVLTYPNHVTIAVKFDKPVGESIVYNGSKYSICEPTPQNQDLSVGQILPELRHESYEIAFAYSPKK